MQLESVAASSQSLGSSDGTVVLTHGFLPLRLASNNRGWGVHTLNFTRRPRGIFWRRKMSCGLFNLPIASDRLRAVFLFGWIVSTLPPLRAWRYSASNVAHPRQCQC